MAQPPSQKDELENKKYRNWVKAGLSLKYFKDGIGDFADECVMSELERILAKLGFPSGSSCNQCSLTTLRPTHAPPSKVKQCPIGQRHCNCLQNNTIGCPNIICGRIYDEIVDSHGTRSPNWKNTDITKWTINPWEIAKCFINAPGYEATRSASDTDIGGLLHLFINSLGFQGHIQCAINLFDKIRAWRNSLFHSPTMELEDQQLTDGINDIITILNDGKELKDKECSKQAIHKLSKLQQENFVITTETEAEVCRAALASITQIAKELKSTQEEAKRDIVLKQEEAEKGIVLKKQEAEKGIVLKQEEAEKEIVLKQREAEKGIVLKQEEAEKGIVLKQREAEKGIVLKQEEAKKNISSRQEEAVKKVQDAADTCGSLFKMEMSELRDTVKALELEMKTSNMTLESEIKALKVRLIEVEHAVKNIKSVEDKTMARLKETEKIIALKRKLKERYRTHYIKTSQSPLKTTENDIEINQVYVPPNMTKLTESTSETGEKEEYTVQILDYSGIFVTDNKPNKIIYILGDVGSGKSAFCKMMMRNWCLSSEVQLESAEEDVRSLEQFELLFYLPLRTLTDEHSLLDMITWYYGDICTKDDLLNIIQLEGERCLVLADGIDEWKPTKVGRRRAHDTRGLPTTDKIDDVTIVMTSRPSVQGILNLEKSNYDVKVILDGIRDVKTFIENLYPKSQSKDILRKLRDVPIKNLKKTPFLLQQIVWLQQQNIDIGKSISEVYSNVVNIAFRWNQKRTEKDVNNTLIAATKFTELTFPDQIKNSYPEFLSHSSVIFGLGKMAFEIMTQGSQLSFGSFELNRNGIDEYIRTKMLGTGLLTEEVRFDNSKENTQFYLTHTSFLEYFAALYIASHRERDNTSGSDSSTCHSSIFDIIMERCHCIQDVIRLENMLVIACGLLPSLTYNVCMLMYESLKQSHIYEQNEIFSANYSLNMFVFERLSEQCRDIALRCVRECKLNDPQRTLNIPYFAVCFRDIRFSEPEKTTEVMQYVDPLSLRCCICLEHYPVENLAVFQNLQILKIEFFEDPADNKLSSLAEYITQTVTLRYISLILHRHYGLRYFDRDIPPSMIHTIDLSKHDHLQLLVLHGVKHIRVDHINTVNLNHCSIRGITCSLFSTHAEELNHLELTEIKLKHDELSDWIELINGSLLLETIEISSVSCSDHRKGSSHVIELLHHNQLQSLDIYGFRGVRLHLKDVVTLNLKTPESTKLRHVKIKNCTLKCDELATLITQSVFLIELNIENNRCLVHQDCISAIDLLRHNHLEVLKGSGVHFSKIITLTLKQCEMNNAHSEASFFLTDKSNQCQLRLRSLTLKHDECSDLAKFITRSVSVKELSLEEIRCLDHDNCSHMIDLSQYTQLEKLTVDRPFSCDKINTSNLTDCSTDNTEVLHCVRDSVNLQTLSLHSLSYSKDVHGCVLTLHKLHTLDLKDLNIEEGVLVMIPEMKCLRLIALWDVNMSEFSCLQFLESLLTLIQSVQCDVDFMRKSPLKQYINNYLSVNKDKFQVEDRRYFLRFRSLKYVIVL